MVDTSGSCKQLMQSLDFFGKYKLPKPHSAMSFHTARNVWVVQKNFFANNFASGLSSLVEGGIYQLWGINDRVRQYRVDTLITFRRMNKIKNGSLSAGLSEAEATTKEQVQVPFVLFGGMLLASVAAFMGELKLKLKILLMARVTPISK